MNTQDDQLLFEAYLKIQKKQDLPLDQFIEKRKAGAADIQQRATKKGGAAMLTAVHFAAKQKPYAHALRACKQNNCAEETRAKADALAAQLKDWSSMSQQQFQHIMGQLEAYGEVYLQAK